MSMAELVVTAVMVQGRTKSEVARDFGIDQAVKAPRGPLRGTVTRDRATGREVVTLAGDVERTVEVSFPPINDLDPVKLVEALVSTDGILPDKWLIRALLKALGEQDIDEILEDITDEDGNLIAPRSSAGQAAVDRSAVVRTRRRPCAESSVDRVRVQI